MTGIRASRTRLLTAAATVAIAALSLTACNDGSGVKDEGASAASSSATPSTPSTPSSSAPATDAGSGSKAPDAKAPATQAPATKTPAADTKPVTCTGSNTKTVAAPLTRPLNHMLLTVTNTGGKPCYLYNYPYVRFGEAQSVPPVIKDSQPQAVVTLAPGESGYAAVLLSAADGSGTNGHTEKNLAVMFQGRDGDSTAGAAHPSLPGEGAYIDDSLKVTYWQQDMDLAITW
ncbi:DUF4232 domain-containing protein [Streptomyces sp. VRA16 Mangrove soil]|uniref:DUF4232 domain-containing protein n=1 Tax=Streptomyces sp. VRA16 Mangrove soil TaxID=2817434 RepID=UPI001A9FA043|nr:DUF4232 domain-containing protein [Streptomyces sp. VRA16 Mangrove soil]MBO1337837.1 DUF4232 domain-containing protein [Streptomyces sp. VRA16 Mangrove soil]